MQGHGLPSSQMQPSYYNSANAVGSFRQPFNMMPPMFNSFQQFNGNHLSGYEDALPYPSQMDHNNKMNMKMNAQKNQQNWNMNPYAYTGNHYHQGMNMNPMNNMQMMAPFVPRKPAPKLVKPNHPLETGQRTISSMYPSKRPAPPSVAPVFQKRNPTMQKPAVQKGKADDSKITKPKRMNLVMAMLPPPSRATSQVINSNKISTISPAKKEVEPPPVAQHFLNMRFLSGSIPEILKWNSAAHKCPPLYQTVGQLIGYGAQTQYPSEKRFILQNLSQLHRESGPKRKLNCTYFSMDRPFEIYAVGTLIRCVGRFLPPPAGDQDHLFQCVSVRKAVDVDIAFFMKKTNKTPSKAIPCSQNNTIPQYFSKQNSNVSGNQEQLLNQEFSSQNFCGSFPFQL